MKQQLSIKTIFTHWTYIAIAVLVILLGASAWWALDQNSRANSLEKTVQTAEKAPADPAVLLEEHGITPLTTAEASQSTTTADDLTYLIEEEKLAHDVYVTMYEKWGVRTFNNIQVSETNHQSMVLAVMQSRGLTDPRKTDVGAFTNPDLQALYNKLVAQGNQSRSEAIKVGVAIEELDIADIKEMVGRLDTKDTDVKNVYETLISGSENHLRAFTRQL